jgi:hypothetical protein
MTAGFIADVNEISTVGVSSTDRPSSRYVGLTRR